MAISRWVYRLVDGLYLHGGFYVAPPDYDPAVEGLDEFQDADLQPDRRLHRGPGRRLATPVEIAAYDDAQANAYLDGDAVGKDVRAALLVIADLHGLTLAQIKARYRAAWKSLP
jgi:hypothetical protein